jgi:hypothetical protein
MKRRKALGLMLLAGGGTAVSLGGYKWWQLNHAPDKAYLDGKLNLLSALAETIIPKTDTPGAKEAGVGQYLLDMVKDCTDKKTQNKFIDGLKDLEQYTQDKYNKSYETCSVDEQILVMKHFQEKGKPFNGIVGKAQNKFLGKSFFTTLKEYTVKGYCSSQLGATQGLAYLSVPGPYIGCTNLQKGQKTWATK